MLVFSDNSKKPSEQIEWLHQCAGNLFVYILFAGEEDEPLYLLHPKAISTLIWINNKILYELPKVKTCINAQWVDVRIRIATNMLNKLVDEGVLTKTVGIMYHDRLVKSVRKILGDIYTEDLPF